MTEMQQYNSFCTCPTATPTGLFEMAIFNISVTDGCCILGPDPNDSTKC